MDDMTQELNLAANLPDDEFGGIPLITFGGIMKAVSELQAPDDRSPDLLNVDILRGGTLQARTGYSVLQDSGADDIPYGGATRIDGLKGFLDVENAKAYIYAAKNTSLHRRQVASGPWRRGYNILKASAKYSAVQAYGPSGDQAIYIANGENEPILAIDKSYPSEWWRYASQIASIVGGASGAEFVITTTAAHQLNDGDIVLFSDIVTEPWATYFNGNYWRVRVTDVDEFKLLDTTYSVVTVPVTGDYTTPLSSQGVIDGDFIGMGRFPRGVYDAGGGTKGYPAVWEDPDGTAGSYWPKGSPDWPAGFAIVNSDVFVRLLAYGFDADPSRVDVSALGEPWNFLKVDVDAADEASADTNPYSDGTYFYVHKGDGDRIVHIEAFADLVVVFKTRTTVVYQGTFGIDLAEKIAIPVGAVSADAVIRIGNDIFFWSEDGPRKLSTAQDYGDILTETSALDILPIVSAIPAAALANITGFHDVRNQRVIWYYPSGGESDPNAALVFYYTRDQYVLWDDAACEMTATLKMHSSVLGQAYFLGGNSSGEVVQLLTGYTDDSVEYEAYYTTKWFKIPQLRAVRIPYLDVIVGESGLSSETKLYIAWDYSPDWEEITTAIQARGSSVQGVWGLSKWGVDFVWGGGGGMRAIRYKVEGRGHSFRIKIVNSGGRNFEIAGIAPEILVRGTR